MASISVYNIEGKETGKIELPLAVFGVPMNTSLLHQVYVTLLNNAREVIAHTKNRAERAGSGKKPWAQKGTGRARIGSVRAPHWRKGGVVFGPRNDRNYVTKANQKMRQKAALVALSAKAEQKKIFVIENFDFSPKKTKSVRTLLVGLGIPSKSSVVALATDEFGTSSLVRNIPRTEPTLAVDLNVRQLLDREYLLISKTGLAVLEKRFAAWKKEQ